MDKKINNLKAFAIKNNVNFSADILEKFKKFADITIEYNAHTNLLSSSDINLIYEKHFTDSISFFKIINPNERIKLLDVGSGGGFPVIPIAIILKNSQIISIDSTKKKVDFLNSVAKEIELNNFVSLNTRAEELAHSAKYREEFDIITARAVGNLALISELALPFLKKGGKFIAYKSTKVEKEIELAKNTITILGGKIIDIMQYDLPLDENFNRNLVIIEKIKLTPQEYPRKYNLIKNKPL